MQQLPYPGRVVWIGLRPSRGADMTGVGAVDASVDTGLVGDRYAGSSGKRHATLIQAEHLPVIAGYLRRSSLAPDLLRRNIVIEGINLLALKGRTVSIGSADFEITGACHPCSKMEQVLGAGGYNALRGHGGVTARVVKSGTVSVDDPVRFSPTHDAPE